MRGVPVIKAMLRAQANQAGRKNTDEVSAPGVWAPDNEADTDHQRRNEESTQDQLTEITKLQRLVSQSRNLQDKLEKPELKKFNQKKWKKLREKKIKEGLEALRVCSLLPASNQREGVLSNRQFAATSSQRLKTICTNTAERSDRKRKRIIKNPATSSTSVSRLTEALNVSQNPYLQPDEPI